MIISYGFVVTLSLLLWVGGTVESLEFGQQTDANRSRVDSLRQWYANRTSGSESDKVEGGGEGNVSVTGWPDKPSTKAQCPYPQVAILSPTGVSCVDADDDGLDVGDTVSCDFSEYFDMRTGLCKPNSYIDNERGEGGNMDKSNQTVTGGENAHAGPRDPSKQYGQNATESGEGGNRNNTVTGGENAYGGPRDPSKQNGQNDTESGEGGSKNRTENGGENAHGGPRDPSKQNGQNDTESGKDGTMDKSNRTVPHVIDIAIDVSSLVEYTAELEDKTSEEYTRAKRKIESAIGDALSKGEMGHVKSQVISIYPYRQPDNTSSTREKRAINPGPKAMADIKFTFESGTGSDSDFLEENALRIVLAKTGFQPSDTTEQNVEGDSGTRKSTTFIYGTYVVDISRILQDIQLKDDEVVRVSFVPRVNGARFIIVKAPEGEQEDEPRDQRASKVKRATEEISTLSTDVSFSSRDLSPRAVELKKSDQNVHGFYGFDISITSSSTDKVAVIHTIVLLLLPMENPPDIKWLNIEKREIAEGAAPLLISLIDIVKMSDPDSENNEPRFNRSYGKNMNSGGGEILKTYTEILQQRKGQEDNLCLNLKPVGLSRMDPIGKIYFKNADAARFKEIWATSSIDVKPSAQIRVVAIKAGTFNIRITPCAFGTDRQARLQLGSSRIATGNTNQDGEESKSISFEVSNVNDVPQKKIHRSGPLESKVFISPFLADKNDGVTVGKIVNEFYTDKDGDKLGMLVLMAPPSNLGKFEYKLPTPDSEWTVITDLGLNRGLISTYMRTQRASNSRTRPTNATIKAVVLSHDSLIRFNFKDIPVWSSVEALKKANIVFSATDHTGAGETAGDIKEVTLPLCTECGTSISKSLTWIYVVRRGCDGEIGSKARVDDCGKCGGRNECKDCAGVINGDSKMDDCRKCSTPELFNQDMVCGDCENKFEKIGDDCIETGKQFCSKIPYSSINKCGICGVDKAEGTDKCNECGGNNACLDCKEEVNGDHVVDACGKCRLVTDTDFNDCAKLGKPSLSEVYLMENERSGLTIPIGRGLDTSEYSKVSCSLVDGENTLILVDTGLTRKGRKTSVAIEVPGTTPSGVYNVTCTFSKGKTEAGGGDSITLTSDGSITLYAPCSVVSISPDVMTLQQKKMKAEITGANFGNPRSLRCFAECSKDSDFPVCGTRRDGVVVSLKAVWKSSTTVECDLSGMVRVKKASSLKLGVQMSKTSVCSNTAIFKVVSPKPTMKTAAFVSSCAVQVVFDMNIEPDHSIKPIKAKYNCIDMFGEETTTQFGRGNYCSVRGRRVVIHLGRGATFKGGEISLKDQSISSKYDSTPNYASGKIEVTVPTKMKVRANSISVRSDVGNCDAFPVRANLGKMEICEQLVFSWSVDLADNQTDVNAEASVDLLNARISSITDSKMIDVTGQELSPGFEYEFCLSVENRLGFKKEVPCKAMRRRDEVQAISIAIRGGNRLDVQPTSPPVIKAKLKFSKCAVNLTRSDVVVIWRVEDSQTGANIDPITSGEPAIRAKLPARSLIGNNTYAITATVVLNGEYFKDTVTWETVERPLDIDCGPVSSSALNADDEFTIDCSKTRNYNKQGGDISDCRFSYECTEMDENAEEIGVCMFRQPKTTERRRREISNSTQLLPLKAVVGTDNKALIPAGSLGEGTYVFNIHAYCGALYKNITITKRLEKVQINFGLPTLIFEEVGTALVNPSKRFIASVNIGYQGLYEEISLTWQSPEEVGFCNFDLENCVSRRITKVLTGNPKTLANYKMTFVYNTGSEERCALEPSCTYRLRFVITISHSKLSAPITEYIDKDLTTESVPEGGSFEVSQDQTGEIRITSKDWDLGIRTLVYRCPTDTFKAKDCDRIGKPTTDEEFTIVLGKGNHNIRLLACNARRICTRSDNFVITKETFGEQELEAAREKAILDAQEGVDITGALTTLSEALADSENEGQGGNENDTLSQEAKDRLEETVNDLVSNDLTSVNPKDVDSSVESIKSIERIDTLSEDNKKTKINVIGETNEQLKGQKESETTGAKRRRRAVSSSRQELPDPDFETIETLLKGYSTVISEQSDFADIESYWTNVTSFKRDICRGLSTGLSHNITDDKHLCMKMNMTMFDDISNVSMNAVGDDCSVITEIAQIALGKSMEDMFKSWTCDGTVNCYGGCLATSQIPNSLLSVNSSGDPLQSTRRSDVIGVQFVNPEANKYADTEPNAMMVLGNLSEPIVVKIPVIGEVDTTLHSLVCYSFDYTTDWTRSECITDEPVEENSVKYVTCSCNRLGYFALFEEDPMTTTQAPSTSVTIPTATQKGSTDTSSDEATRSEGSTDTSSDEATRSDGIIIKASNETKEEITSSDTTMASTTTHKQDMETTSLKLALDADFNAVVGDDKNRFIEVIKPQIASVMKVEKQRIINMDVYKGSIVVTFDLVPSASGSVDTASSVAIATLQTAVGNGTWSLTDSSGKSLPVLVNSFTLMTTMAMTTPMATKESEPPMEMGMIIGIAVGGGLVVLIIIVIIIVVCKKNSNVVKRVTPSPDPSMSSTREPLRYIPHATSAPKGGAASFVHVNETSTYNSNKAAASRRNVRHRTDTGDVATKGAGSRVSLRSNASTGKGRMMVTSHGPEGSKK